MKKLVSYAILFGSTGGCLKSLCILVAAALYPRGYDIYSTIFGGLTSQILFITPVCLAKGAAENSPSLLKKGTVIGVATAIIATSISLSLIFFKVRGYIHFQPWFDRVFVPAIFLGVAVSVVSGFGNEARRPLYLVGFVAGAIASFSHYFTSFLTFSLAFLLSEPSSDMSVLFQIFAIHPLDGAAQAVIIWSVIAVVERKVFMRSNND